MKSLLRASALFAIVFSTQLPAEESSWLEKKEPDSLFVGVFADEACPESTDEIRKTVDSALIRARLKSQDGWDQDELLLSIQITCLALKSGNAIFDIDVEFGRMSSKGDTAYFTTIYADDFGTFGMGGVEYFQQAVKSAIDAALTEYLKANFDLGAE